MLKVLASAVALAWMGCGGASAASDAPAGGDGPPGGVDAGADAAHADAPPPCTGPDCCPGPTYATSFELDEATISEGGRWAHAANVWQHVRTVGGRALPAAYTESYDDAYAYLGCWTSGDDYEVIATAYFGGTAAEAEILLRVTDSPTGVSAYEFLYNTGGSWQFVRWNGPLGDFTVLDGGSTPDGSADRQVRATIVGSTVDLYWRVGPPDAWTHLATIEDSVLATGKPGMSFYAHEIDQNLDKVGFADWRVTSL